MTTSVRLASGVPVQTRIGVSALTRLAFDGKDLGAVWNKLLAAIESNQGNAGTVMDLSVLAQLLGDPLSGERLQQGALQISRLYRSPTTADAPYLRLLALAGATDLGGNIPLEFLIGGSDVELITLYVVPGQPLPNPLPEHDIALVAVGYSDTMTETLEDIEDATASWPRPLLNSASDILNLRRDNAYALLEGASGVEMPRTIRVSREALEDAVKGKRALMRLMGGDDFPIIIRPVDSHAGRGLDKMDNLPALDAYLAIRAENEFFISRFVNYCSSDGLFRKYRIVFVNGRAYACHMAIASDWKVWYLNADMAESPAKRAEEASFMREFDREFAVRHEDAFQAITARLNLDYFGIDCAETQDGKLLLFECETAMIVHDMDPPQIYPYKGPQMRKLFAAFVAMLHDRARLGRARAA